MKRMVLWLLLAGGLAAEGLLGADDVTDQINALKQQIQELNEKVRALEQQVKSGESPSTNAAPPAGKPVPVISAGANGFSFRSADTNFALSLRGYLQLDSRSFFNGGTGPGDDGFVLRRVRPIFSGTVFSDFEFRIMPEFAGGSPSIYDAYVNYAPGPQLQLQAGKFKSPIGLERLQSAKNLAFNERSLATDLVPVRDLGAELHGALWDHFVSYAAGAFNGVADEANAATHDFDNDVEFAGRIFLEPMKDSDLAALEGLGIGVAGGYGEQSTAGGVTGGYTTDGQRKFFSYTNGVVADGIHWRLSPQGYYYFGPLSLLGEYVISDQRVRNGAASAELRNRAWEISGGWVLTGEEASYEGISPRSPFNPGKGQWGAWQLVARYAELDVDRGAFPVFADPDASARAARAWAVGLNWWLNSNVRIQTSFSRTTFSGGGAGPVGGQPEEVFFSRAQLAF